jgi:hypothetical protein
MIRLIASCFLCFMISCVAVESRKGAETTKKPAKAAIVDVRKLEEWSGDPVGNVEVTYADGTRDQWTKLATSMMPKVAADGVVGWVDCSITKDGKAQLGLNHRGTPIGSHLILCDKGKITVKITSGKAFIEEWGFDPDGKHVVMLSRASHGPAVIERFSRANGKAAGSVAGADEDAPGWAKPYVER